MEIQLPNSVVGDKLTRLINNVATMSKARLPTDALVNNYVVPILRQLVEAVQMLDGATAEAGIQAQAALQLAGATANGNALDRLFDLYSALQESLAPRLQAEDEAMQILAEMTEVFAAIDTEGRYFEDEDDEEEADDKEGETETAEVATTETNAGAA